MSDRPVIWVHGDNLNPGSPAFLAHPGSPAIFVFDEVVLEGYRVTLKRIAFIYESLLELPVVIRRGDVADEVLAFAREHGASQVVTMTTPSPRFAAIAGKIGAATDLVVMDDVPFVTGGYFELKRFSRYWQKAERSAMRPTNAEPPPATLNLPGMEP